MPVPSNWFTEMQPLERPKQLGRMLHIEPGPVVTTKYTIARVSTLVPNSLCCRAPARELSRIADEIFERGTEQMPTKRFHSPV
jgi:hypothetical protein